MSFRESLSGFKKDIKQRFKGSKRKPGRKGAVPGGDGVDSLESGPQPVGGSTHDQGAGVVGEPVDSARPSVSRDGPGPTSAGETNEQVEGTDAGRSKVSTVQESGLLSHVGVLVGTGYGNEVEQVHSSLLSTPTPHVAKTSGMSTSLPFPPSLLIPPKTSPSLPIMNQRGFILRAEPTQPTNPSIRYIGWWRMIDECLHP